MAQARDDAALGEGIGTVAARPRWHGMKQPVRAPAPASSAPVALRGNAPAPYHWEEWDGARAAGIVGRSGLSREQLQRLIRR